jgi:hypothetical protein
MDYYFKEGDDVAHKDNLGIKLEVIRVIKEFKKFNTTRGNSTLQETRCVIKGIECGWWGPDKIYYKNVFHSNSLVPWHIAETDYVTVMKYMEERATFKLNEKSKFPKGK